MIDYTSIQNEIQRIQGKVEDTYDIAEAKGAEIPATKNIDNLPATVASITGGGTPTPDLTDPVYVYKTQRNPEWLNMLGTGYGENYDEMESYYDTADNEIRLLFHLTPPADNLIAFNVHNFKWEIQCELL